MRKKVINIKNCRHPAHAFGAGTSDLNNCCDLNLKDTGSRAKSIRGMTTLILDCRAKNMRGMTTLIPNIIKLIQIFIFSCLILNLQSCSKENKSSNEKIISLEAASASHTLFYSGIIQPLQTLVVPSSAEGVVVEMPFQYGQRVEAGELLFVISSTKFLSDYKSALMNYVKAKSDMNNAQTLLNEGKFLHKNQLISDDDFKTKQSSYYGARLALLQAKDTLENLLQQLNIKNINLYDLKISDIDKINQAMHLQKNSDNLRVLAPANGIILSPIKNSDNNKKTMKGDVVKQGDVLAVIGNLDGIRVNIKVNELTVNQLHVGQPVKITGIAFPDQTLNGEIIRVDKQGEVANGGLPTFNVEVSVKKLNEIQQKNIHVGMSAKIEINIKEDSQLIIPLSAVTEKNGKAFVNVWNEKIKQTKLVAVQTGKTNVDSIVILAGLKSGDKIVVSH